MNSYLLVQKICLTCTSSFEVHNLFIKMCCVNYIALFCPTTLTAQFTWAYLANKESM